jgi:hypothetical protein
MRFLMIFDVFMMYSWLIYDSGGLEGCLEINVNRLKNHSECGSGSAYTYFRKGLSSFGDKYPHNVRYDVLLYLLGVSSNAFPLVVVLLQPPTA